MANILKMVTCRAGRRNLGFGGSSKTYMEYL